MIVEQLLCDISNLLQMDKNNQELLVQIINQCQRQEFMGRYEFRILTNLGIPIGKILKTFLNLPMEQIIKIIDSKGISYEHTLYYISIFARDLMYIKQQR